jgi:opacity protein-like surface antigen
MKKLMLTLGTLVLLMNTAFAADPAANSSTPQAKEKWPSRAATEDLDWSVVAYVAWLSEEALGDMLLGSASLESDKLYALGLNKRLYRWDSGWDFEVEGQVAKQAGPSSRNWEINGLGAFRWNRFYWDRYLNTSFAVGLGLSYALDEPQFEIDSKDDTSKLLAYILVDMDFSLPKYPNWALDIRIHHRSSAYGAFNDNIRGASNALGVGLKYRW